MSEIQKPGARLDLDPGVRQRKAHSGCRCLFLIGLLLAVLVIGWIFYFIGSTFANIVSSIRFPHKMHYHNATSNVSLPGSVVRPLIDSQQTFDIAVSVWMRATEEEEEEYRRRISSEVEQQENGKDKDLYELAPTISQDGKLWTVVNASELIRDENILETPLYSDIALRGLRLSDKDISTVINFRLATARFRGANLTAHDLRASFVVIPSSPSPLDYLTNFSSWRSERLPRRSRPFPLGSPERTSRSLTDEALESFSISIPLIEFREIQSRCPNSVVDEDGSTDDGNSELKGSAEAENNDADGDDSDDDGDDDENHGFVHVESVSVKNKMTPVHKYHPHVITRTQLRIVDETHLFNRKKYNKAHKALKERPCFPSGTNACYRDYFQNGHWETRMQLEVPKDGNNTDTEIQWAYSPYLSTLRHGAGPLDFIAVPVSRENCTNNETSSEVTGLFNDTAENEFMNITWRISFSGRTAGKLTFGDLVSWSPRVNHNASEYKKMMAHDTAELINGLHGHKFHEDAHPRRRLFLMTLMFVCTLIHEILDVHYWSTRASTVSISISGTALLALSSILGTFVDIVSPASIGSNKQSSVVLMLTLAIFMLLTSSMMIKAITRIDFRWWKGTTWIPIAQRAAATHKERASMRLDARMSWRTKGGLFLSFLGIYYFLSPQHHVIFSTIPAPMAEDFTEKSKLQALRETLVGPLELTGLIAQLVLNHRSHTFAGQYKLTVVVGLILQLLVFPEFVPAVVGRMETRMGISAQNLINMALWVVMGWQALVLPSVSKTEGDDDDE